MFLVGATSRAGELPFRDDFKGNLGEGWSWVREHREYWRVTQRGLEVRIEPGNMWGPANDARNVLVRPAPDATKGEVEVSVYMENTPSEQYEQVDLVWYYDDGHMVKIGRELVDGKISIVMGREQDDRTQTIAIVPLQIPVSVRLIPLTDTRTNCHVAIALVEGAAVRLRLQVKGDHIRGQFRAPDGGGWREAGECDLPTPANGNAKISLQFYQGPAHAEHWARVTEFRIRRTGK